MTEETLIMANEIKSQIDRLQYEAAQLPRKLVSSANNKYTKRVLRRMERKRKFILNDGSCFYTSFEMQLTDEDLKALVEIREKKIRNLKEELAALS